MATGGGLSVTVTEYLGVVVKGGSGAFSTPTHCMLRSDQMHPL